MALQHQPVSELGKYDPRPHTLGMKLHTPTGEDGVRLAEYHAGGRGGFEVSVVDDCMLDDPKVRTVRLTAREAKALRHWLDAALRDA